MQSPIPIDPELEYNYNLRDRRKDVADVMQRWSESSKTFRQHAEASIDSVYGPNERERLDIFHCGNIDAPVFAFVHGGYWQRGDKSVYSFIAPPFVAAGMNVVIVGYDLCPAVTITRISQEAREATAYVWRNAGDLGIKFSVGNVIPCAPRAAH